MNVEKCGTRGLALVVSGILLGVTALASRAAAQSAQTAVSPSSLSKPASDAKVAAMVPLSSGNDYPSLYAAPPPSQPSALMKPPVQQASLTSNLKSDIHREIAKLSPEARHALQEFEIASAQFPSFCKDWERKLGDRERDNVTHPAWQTHNGVAIGTYLGYSKIESCTSKEASNGTPIGELSYHEINYAKTGPTLDAARNAPPKVTGETQTMEIFSWDKGKWFY